MSVLENVGGMYGQNAAIAEIFRLGISGKLKFCTATNLLNECWCNNVWLLLRTRLSYPVKISK